MRKLHCVMLLAILAVSLVSCVACNQQHPSGFPYSGHGEDSLASDYPAEISGYVTIADKLRCGWPMALPPSRGDRVFWIVEVSVKNVEYGGAVEALYQMRYQGWEIVAKGEVYKPSCTCSSTLYESVSVAPGETGQFMFYDDVPRTLCVSDGQICYRGQEPYSYGELSGGKRVAAYDWHSKSEVEEEIVEDTTELYFAGRPFDRNKFVDLRTIGTWVGSGPELIHVNVEQSPWVLNFGSKGRSKIGSRSSVIVWRGKYDGTGYAESIGGYPFQNVAYDPLRGVSCIIVYETGDFTIEVEASGCEWLVKIGVE